MPKELKIFSENPRPNRQVLSGFLTNNTRWSLIIESRRKNCVLFCLLTFKFSVFGRMAYNVNRYLRIPLSVSLGFFYFRYFCCRCVLKCRSDAGCLSGVLFTLSIYFTCSAQYRESILNLIWTINYYIYLCFSQYIINLKNCFVGVFVTLTLNNRTIVCLYLL